MKMNGARILLECLKLEGVDTVFGYPGGTVINLYDELFSFTEIKHILPRHEQAGVHAADGYARASGKVGVAIATSGPGATNTITGIATAYMDSIPLVIITGQVPTALIGNDAFQEADIIGITRPCTKHNFLVKDVKDLATIVKKAFYIARSGRPGPVLIDFPKDVQIATTEFKYPDSVDIRGYKPTLEGHPRQVEKAVNMMLAARKPVIYVGGGVILGNAATELTELARAMNIPVTTTLMGLGAFPEDDPLSLGLLGMHGSYYANMAVSHTDLLIAVGARFDDRVTGKIATFAPHAKIIHIDVDPTSIKKNVRVDLPIVGDVKGVLAQMLKVLEEHRDKLAEFKANICSLARGDCGVEGRSTPWPTRQSDHRHQAPVRHPEAARAERRQCHHRHRRRAAPDVDRPVLQVHPAADSALLRRARYHGLRPAGGHGGAGGLSRAAGDRDLRGRRFPDELCRNWRPWYRTGCR